jgi:multidrug efflux pump subunit AcrB
MALNVSAWSIRHPLPPIVIMAALLVVGYGGLRQIPITRMPNVDVPLISVIVTQFGGSPADLEKQVSKKIEDAVAGVGGVNHIRTVISDGISNTMIEFRLDTNTDRALNDVKDAITLIRADLPRTIDEPMVRRFDIVGLPILTYAASAQGKTPEEISWFVQNDVVGRLQAVKGVASVDRIGSVEKEIRVALNPLALEAIGLTAVSVSQQLYGNNADFAGGRSELGGRDQAIRTLGQARTLTDLKATRIRLPGGGDVRLDTIAEVTEAITEPTTFARSDGIPVVGFSILRAKGASDVEVAKAVQAEIDNINKDYKNAFKIDLKDTSVDYTVGNYHAALENLFEGAVLAILVVFLFLRDWRATIIAALTLPLSILPSFWVMNALGFSLNMLTLLAIVLSTGILVDDAIVEIENIIRHIRMGKTPYRAALDAADEIGLAVIAISLTIVAVFLPASFMTSIPGQFFKQFGVTVSIQVLFSLLCARLITPMLAAYFLKPHQHEEKADGRAMGLYTRLVTWSVRHRYITVLIGLLVFAAALGGASRLPRGFLPPQDTGRSTLAIELPPGSQLADTQAVTDAVADRMRRRPEVESVFVNGGKIYPATQEVRKATLTINYTPRSKRSLSQKQLEQAISQDLADIPDFRFWYLDENGQRNVDLVVAGPDARVVANFASDLALDMRRKVPQVTNIVSTGSLNRTELQIRPYRDLATRYGVSTENLSQTIRVATIGDVGPALAKYDAGDRIVPIRVLLEEQARGDLQVLEQLRVPSPGGGSVPLSALAAIRLGEGSSGIQRYDRKVQATVGADLVNGAALSEALAAVDALEIMNHRPPGINVVKTGDAELQAQLFSGFEGAMRDGLTIVYALLAVLFGSLLQPLTILLSLPLSVAGAIIALLLAHLPITTPVLIGILMLMGIVSKNAIMLVDFAVEEIRHGVERNAAIIDAGRKRARPIIMTTVAMIGGMGPSAFGVGPGGDMRAPMAIAVIGGLIVATMLSLLFVPAVFTIMEAFGDFCWRWLHSLVGTADEPEPAHATSIAMKNPEGEPSSAGGARGRSPEPAHSA